MLTLALSLSGSCRSGPVEIALFYPPRVLESVQPAAPRLPVEDPRIEIRVEDRRVRPEVVGVERGLYSMALGRIRAINAGDAWTDAAARFELEQAGLQPVGPGLTAALGVGGSAGETPPAAPDDPRPTTPLLRLELELLEARSAADAEHPGEVLLGAVLLWDGRVHQARRVRGTSAALDAGGVPIDPAESLAVALREALRPLAQEAAALALSRGAAPLDARP